MAAELLEGEILEEYRTVVDAAEPEKKKSKTMIKTDVDPCTDTAGCSENCGGGNTTGGTTGGTSDAKKRKKTASVAGWFDPPTA